MDKPSPSVRHVTRRCAPKRAPCPHCGKWGRRKQLLHRTVRDIALGDIVYLHVITAEYRARCACCRTFRSQVPGIEAKARYTNRVRQAVLDRLIDDRMSLERIQASLARDFYVDLSVGFLYDCLDWKIRQLDHAAYRAWVLQQFSGTLCVDEIHLGRATLLLATDPLRDLPIAFAVVQVNDQEHLRRFLGQLRDHGFQPRVVITDGSNLYPAVLAQLWPTSEHQLCVFHVLQDIHDYVMAGVRRRCKSMRGAACRRPRRRGRPRRRDTARFQKQRDLQQRAQFVYRRRFLIVTRRDHLSPRQQEQLHQTLEHQPALRLLRRFVDAVHHLLEAAQTEAQAWHRYECLMQDPAFTADPDLAPALKLLAPAQFTKMIAFLRSRVGQRVRTNNHVERLNRQLRYYEKVRYRWRLPRRIVGFVLLTIHRRWQQRPRVGTSPSPSDPAPQASVGATRAAHLAAMEARAPPVAA